MKTAAFIGLLTLAVIATGCLGMSPDDIAKKMQEKYDSLEDYQGTMVVTADAGGEGKVMESDFKFKKPNKHWSMDKETGRVTVSNGNTLWMYFPEKNEVRIMKFTGREEQPEMDFGPVIKDMMERFDVKLRGTEKIAGRNSYIIELLPKEGTGFQGKQKLWVDKEYWMPLKMEMEMKVLNETVRSSILYKDIKFNAGILDSDFEFVVPEGAKVVEKEIKMPEKMTLEEAQKEVGFNIATPSYLPEGYEFDSALVHEVKDEKRVSLAYKKDGTAISLSEKAVKGELKPLPDAEEVRINGNKGWYASSGAVGILSWTCNDLELTLSSPLPKEEMVKIAESVKC